MPSSTSSSEPRHSRRSQARHTLIVLAIFSLLTGLSSAAWFNTPLRYRRLAVADAALLPPEDYFLSVNKVSLEHSVLYHGMFSTGPALKQADVLFLGTSRALYAFTRLSSRPFFGRHGMRPYLLAFDHSETARFPSEIIRKFDLHPRLVIVNADYFFQDESSPLAKQVMAESEFDASKNYFEFAAAFRVQRLLHRVVPHVVDLLLHKETSIAHRSRIDGCRVPYPEPAGGEPIPDAPGKDEPVTPKTIEAASRFKAMIEGRGGRLILTYIPNAETSRRGAETTARSLDVPLIAPHPPGLATFDGSHLDPRSADIFMERFLRELEEYLKRDPLHPRPAHS